MEHLKSNGDAFDFWIDWYEKCLNGAPQDWEGLLTDIALIDPVDWDKGPKHIAGMIERLRERRMARAAEERQPRPLAGPPPAITEVQRSHIQLVIATAEPSAQSAETLQQLFAEMRTQYLREIGLPNEDPPEIAPFTLLSEIFGSMAQLLRQNADQERLIRDLSIRIEDLERANLQLVAASQRAETPLLKVALVTAVGTAFGTAGGAALIASYTQLGGPTITEGANAIWNLWRPGAAPPPMQGARLPPTIDL